MSSETKQLTISSQIISGVSAIGGLTGLNAAAAKLSHHPVWTGKNFISLNTSHAMVSGATFGTSFVFIHAVGIKKVSDFLQRRYQMPETKAHTLTNILFLAASFFLTVGVAPALAKALGQKELSYQMAARFAGFDAFASYPLYAITKWTLESLIHTLDGTSKRLEKFVRIMQKN